MSDFFDDDDLIIIDTSKSNNNKLKNSGSRRPASSSRNSGRNGAPRKNTKRTYGKKKSKKNKNFMLGVIIYASLLFVISIGVLIALWSSLSKYQKRIDEEDQQAALLQSLQRAPQEYFEKTVDGMTIEDWVKIWYETHPEHYDLEDDVKEFVKQNVVTKELSKWKAPEYTSENPVYLVKADDTPVAEFFLNGADFDWYVSKKEMLISGNESISITIPKECTPYINGIAIDDKYITDFQKTESVDKYEDSLTNPVEYKNYLVEGLVNQPAIAATVDSGEYQTSTDTKGNIYLTLSSEDAEAYKKKAESFIKSILVYFTMGSNNTGGNMTNALSYVAANSQASSIIRQSYDGVTWRSPGKSVYETETSNVYKLADNAYCVDVLYSDTTSDNAEKVYEIYRVYFLDLGKGFQIYNFGLY